MIQAFFGKTEPNWMQEVASDVDDPTQFWLHAGSVAITGCYLNASESDPACGWGGGGGGAGTNVGFPVRHMGLAACEVSGRLGKMG